MPWQVPPCRQGSRSWQGFSSCSQRSPAGHGRGEWHELELLLTTPRPSLSQGLGSSHTFEAISTQTLKLKLASRKARGAVLARLALTWGAVIALPDAPAAQEAVGEV